MKSQPAVPEERRAEFDALYAQHSRAVWSQAYSRWLDADLALDIVQEAFLRLWKHWEAGDEVIQNIRAWLLRVARNLAEDYAKSAFRKNGTMAPEQMGSVRSQEILPIEMMEQQEAFAQIRETLQELPPEDRNILTLKYAMDYDAAEIAEMLGINTTAVHMRLSRARQRMAEKLKAQGFTPI